MNYAVWTRRLAAWLAPVLLLVSAAAAQPACGDWVVEPSPNFGPDNNTLYGIEMIAPDDIWAVGRYVDPSNLQDTPLALHWDGGAWTQVPVDCNAHPLKPKCTLNAVTAVASNDVLAVGSFHHPDNLDWETVSVHWDGTQWTWVPSPQQQNGEGSVFLAAEAIASNDVWAVGTWPGLVPGAFTQPLAAHWDGTQWTEFFVPFNTGDENFDDTALSAISAVSSDDVWAVGWHELIFTGHQPFIVHWDGTAWSVFEPRPDPLYTSTSDVKAFASDDVWVAANKVNPADQFNPFDVLLHWDGSSWTEYMMEDADLIAGIAPDDIWAAGGGKLSHWDGTAWTLVYDTVIDLPALVALDATSTCDVWGVGWQQIGPNRTMTLRLTPASDLAVTLTPVNPPVVVPPEGGSFQYTLSVANNGAAAQTVDLWISHDGPGVSRTLGPISRTLAPGGGLNKTLTQKIPANAPAGTYSLAADVGTFPTSEAGDSFTFEKQAVAPGRRGPAVTAWTGSLDLGDTTPVRLSAAGADVPGRLALDQNYPNPFNPSTEITYALPEAAPVRLAVYDLTGRVVRTLVEAEQQAGRYRVHVDVGTLPAGVYLYVLDVGTQRLTCRMTLLK